VYGQRGDFGKFSVPVSLEFSSSVKQIAPISVIQSEERKKSKSFWRCVMSKFIIQMLLSVSVAVGAAAGFSPAVKSEVNKGFREVQAFAREVTRLVFDAGSTVDAEAEASLESSTEIGLGDVETELELAPGAEIDLGKSSRKSEGNFEASFAAESESEAEIELERGNPGLENEIQSDLDLEVGIGK
jgi:hypothetical protein